MDYEQYIKAVTEVEARLARASEKLKGYPRSSMGLTPDQVKLSPEYKRDRQEYNEAFSELRAINAKVSSAFKRRRSRERRGLG